MNKVIRHELIISRVQGYIRQSEGRYPADEGGARFHREVPRPQGALAGAVPLQPGSHASH